MTRKRRERWYSLDGQRKIHEASLRDNSGPRRVVSLVVLLILVLMMMQQVSDPKKVQKVATAVGLMPNPNQTTEATPQSSSQISNLSATSELPPTLANSLCDLSNRSPISKVEFFAQALERLLQDAPKDTIADLVHHAFQLSDESLNQEASDNWISKASTKLQRWIELSDSTHTSESHHDQLIELLAALEQLAPERISTESIPTDNDSIIEQALRLALDRVLLKSFADNTPWKSTERIPLARLLQKATSLSQPFEKQTLLLADIPTLSTQQLMSQTDTLRGQCFRIEGTVGLIEASSSLKLTSPKTSNSQSENQSFAYDVLWLKTDDPSGQPIQVYIPQSLRPNSEATAEAPWKIGDSISMAALIAKRRAYASARGGDISPVVIATYLHHDRSGATSPSEQLTNPLITQALAKLRATRDWLPPIDWKIPMELVQSSLSKRLPSLPSSIQSTPETVQVQPEALSLDLLATLANANKFRNEIRQIVSANCYSILASPPHSNPDTDQPNNPPTSKVLGQWSGQISSIKAIPVDTSEMPGLGWSQIYALYFLPSSPPNSSNPKPILALCTEIPQSWKNQTSLSQPVTIQGLGIFPIETTPQPSEAPSDKPSYILASRLLWTLASLPATPCDDNPSDPNPTTANLTSLDWTSPPLSEGWKSLALANWDLSQCDSLERLHGNSISSADTEPFYSMLNLTRSITSEYTPFKNPLSAMEWIKRTESMKANKQSINDQHRSVGERIKARFLVRRIQRIEVRNPEHQRWLGASAYYQLDGLASIGNNRIAVRYGKGVDPITFEKEFPMTLVAANVPAWVFQDPNPTSLETSTNPPLPTEQPSADQNSNDPSTNSIAWYPRIRVDVEGWAYRTWRFRTIEVSAATDDTGFQQAPMLMVDRWQLAQGPEPRANGNNSLNPQSSTSPARNNNLASILTTILGLAAIAWFAYRFISSSKRSIR